jgi:hypothetical protein
MSLQYKQGNLKNRPGAAAPAELGKHARSETAGVSMLCDGDAGWCQAIEIDVRVLLLCENSHAGRWAAAVFCIGVLKPIGNSPAFDNF